MQSVRSWACMLLIGNHILPLFGKMVRILVGGQHVQTFVFRKLDEGLSLKTVKVILIVLKTVTRFSIKNQMTEYRRIDIKFPTERDKQSIDILSRSHQRHIMEYVQSHLTFKNLASFFRTSHKLQGYSRRRYYNCSPATKEDYSSTAHRPYRRYFSRYARPRTAPTGLFRRLSSLVAQSLIGQLSTL